MRIGDEDVRSDDLRPNGDGVVAVMEAAAGVRQVQLALLLAESGVPSVIIGGTARLLRGERHTPEDLDLLVRPAEAAQLRGALHRFSIPTARATSIRDSPWTVSTSWSQVDVFVKDDLPAWREVEVDGVGLRVADE